MISNGGSWADTNALTMWAVEGFVLHDMLLIRC